MSLLTGLPEILAIELISSFSDVVDLCRLDTAFCNSRQRRDLLYLFHNDQFVLENLQQGNLITGSESSLWMNKRNILVGKIYLRRIRDPSSIPSILAYNLTKVKYLQIDAAEVDEVASLINQCPCLKFLDIMGYICGGDDFILINSIDVKILGQLVEFTFNFNHRISKGTIGWVAENCKMLHVFSVSSTGGGSIPAFCQSEISSIFRNNPDLRRVNLVNIPMTLLIIEELAQCCPLLTHLTLSNKSGTIQKLTEWVQIITSFKYLQHLHNEHSGKFEYCNSFNVKSVNIAVFHEGIEVTPGSIALFTEFKGFTSLTLKALALNSQLVCDLITKSNADTLSSLKIVLEPRGKYQDFAHFHVLSVARLLTQCKCLTTLCLQCYYWVSPEDWTLTASSTSTLRSLVIQGSNTLTIDDIVCWMDNNKLLTSIKITSCNKIEKPLLKRLQSHAHERNMTIEFEYTDQRGGCRSQ